MLFPDASDEALGPVVLSASDLRAASTCEHAMLAELDVRLGRREGVEAPVDEMARRAAELGVAHEQRVLQRLNREHPGGVRGASAPERTRTGLEAGMAETLALMADPAVQVIHQACVFDGDFLGFVDFLVRDDDGAWVVCDAKLARSESVTALLQAGAYAQVLRDALAERDDVRLAPFVRLVLGDNEVSDTRLADLLPVVRARRARLAQVVGDHLAEDAPVVWEDERWERCLRCETCEAELTERDDVLRVAKVHLDQRAALHDAGITTAAQLADLPEGAVIPGIRAERLEAIVAQARLQRSAAETGGLPFEVHAPEALASIPPSSEGDVFFDFEGDPTWHVPGSGDWGLEYLFGCLYVDDGKETYRAFWAHDRDGERQALVEFLDWLQQRRRRWPDLHVYHYANYERAALLRLAARHGVGQEQVDGLLVDGVLVDLYDVVKAAVRVGSPSYSIKKLEPLYMGEERRDDDGVTGGGDSIVEYHRYAQAVIDGDQTLADKRLEDIRQYNEYDCLSTLRLRDWLLARATEAGVEPTPSRADADPDAKVEDPNPLEVALRDLVDDVPRAERTPEQQALAMLGAAVQYHRREDKPFWWGYFERLERGPSQWARGTDVFVATSAEELDPWAKPARGNLRRTIRLRGEMTGGARVGAGSKLVAVYAPAPGPLRQGDLPNGAREVLVEEMTSEIDDDGFEVTTIVAVESLPTKAEPYDDLPVGLGPTPGPNTSKIAGAIAEVAQSVLDAGRADADEVTSPATDLLRRVPPRLVGGATLPRSGDSITDLRQALLALDRSYIAVQGPPGTGKTYVASQVIARLVLDHGWRVGVVAQSHAAVEHLLDCVVAAGVPGEQVGKAPQSAGVERAWTVLTKAGYASFAEGHTEAGRGYVVGGTAWDLTHEERVARGQLDLVVVDEAGQYALAPTIACSVAGKRLLLLGDPQQLPQVSQGTHAEPVDESALGWLLDGRATMPAELGYFLGTTWRLHPDLTLPVSHLAYEGQLASHEPVTTSRALEGVEPGLHVVPVEHTDRTTSSPEEAEAIVALVRDLEGRAWTASDSSGSPRPARPLTPADVLVVTAYNHQVRTVRQALDAAGLPEVRVGTVDKLQGQEAPVVVLSMCASSVHDVSRGLRFLLSRNRLNVAISRAQHAAYLVMSPRLHDAAPRTPHELRALGAFMGLIDAAQSPTLGPEPRDVTG